MFVLLIGALQMTTAQNKNTLRAGIGVDFFNPSFESHHSPWIGPSLFTEFGHTFNDYVSMTVTLNTDMRKRTEGRGDDRFILSLCAMAKPFAKKHILNRLELGAGVTGEYRTYYDDGRNSTFNPGIDIPVRIYLIDTEKYDLCLMQISRFLNNKNYGFKRYDINFGVMFGVKF